MLVPHQSQMPQNAPQATLVVIGLALARGRAGLPISSLPLQTTIMPDLLTEITDAAKAYYAQSCVFSLTATDFYDWRAALPAARRAEVLAHGFTASQAEPDFLRFCLEWRGYDMRSFMSARLSVAAFELWVANGEFNGDLPPHAVSR